jgi:dihydrodipicolinate synthase/N-acetylneuraminate lyase
MIQAAAAESEKQSRELVSVASLVGTAEFVERRASSPVHEGEGSPKKPSSSAVTVVGKLKTRKKEVGFQVMVGAAHQLEPSLGLGAVGAILAFASAAPMACYEIFAALKDGDTALAREKQDAMDLGGYYGGPARLPFLPLSGEQKTEIEKLMAGIKS